MDETVFSSFSSQSQSVKRAAAVAFGNIAIGNLDKCVGSHLRNSRSEHSLAGTSRRYLPSLLEKIKSSPEQRYLLLSALKEIISRHTIDIHSISVRVQTRNQPASQLLLTCYGGGVGVRAAHPDAAARAHEQR
jgi:hypothetical protein